MMEGISSLGGPIGTIAGYLLGPEFAGAIIGIVANRMKQKHEIEVARLQLEARQFDERAQIRELEHAEKGRGHELELLRLQASTKIEEVETGMRATIVSGSYDGLKASLEHDKAAGAGVSQAVADKRAMVRVNLTSRVFWIVAAAAGVVVAYNMLAGPALREDVIDFLIGLARTILGLAITVWLWWFGDRPSAFLQSFGQGGTGYAAPPSIPGVSAPSGDGPPPPFVHPRVRSPNDGAHDSVSVSPLPPLDDGISLPRNRSR